MPLESFNKNYTITLSLCLPGNTIQVKQNKIIFVTYSSKRHFKQHKGSK